MDFVKRNLRNSRELDFIGDRDYSYGDNEYEYGDINYSSSSISRELKELEVYLMSNSCAIYTAVNRLSNIELELKLMLEFYENNKEDVYNDVIEFRSEVTRMMSLKLDKFIISMLRDVIEVLDDWLFELDNGLLFKM